MKDNKELKAAEVESVKSETSLKKRRAIVASIAAAGAGGLPSQWKKPVVDHVLLPAHAEMSPTGTFNSGSSALTSSATFTATAFIECTDTVETAFYEEFETDPRNGGRAGDKFVSQSATVSNELFCTSPTGGETMSGSSFSFANPSARSGVTSGVAGPENMDPVTSQSYVSEESTSFTSGSSASFSGVSTFTITGA